MSLVSNQNFFFKNPYFFDRNRTSLYVKCIFALQLKSHFLFSHSLRCIAQLTRIFLQKTDISQQFREGAVDKSLDLV